jgi:DNA-binding response OmpR family regulator
MTNKATILVIDDDADICQAIQKGLELPGVKLQILTALTGTAGLQLAKSHLPDVIILDLQLPDGDGFMVFDELRLDAQLAQTRVIMLTAQDSAKNLWDSIDRRLDDFITKPLDLMELEARVYTQLLKGRPDPKPLSADGMIESR